MKACECNESLGNTGVPGCQPLFKVAKKEFFVPIFDSTGAKNNIDLSVPITQAFLDGKLNEIDATKRWYPTPIIENVVSERAESAFDEAPSGNKDFIKQGTRSESYEIRNQNGVLKGQLDTIRCNSVGKFVVDVDNSIRGMIIPTALEPNDGFLYPIKIDNNSFDVNYNFQSDTTVNKLVVSYDYAQGEDDANLRMIAGSEITADLLGANGLVEVYATYTAISLAGFTVQLSFAYGSQSSLVPDSGLLITDFYDVVGGSASNVFNVTDVAAEALATVTETIAGSGVYDVVFAAPVTNLDVIRVTPDRNGRSYTNVINKTFVAIP